MKRLLTSVFLLIIAAPLTLAAPPGSRRDDAVKRLGRAGEVFTEIMAAPDAGIPEDLLDKSECIAIVPGITKGGFVVGARYGKGVVMCRKKDRSWTAPAFITVSGGSVGLQIGLQKVDLVMVIMNRHGMEQLIGDEFTIGADASAAAGPVGRQTSAETNIRLDAEILTYSRAKGLFAGVTLNGAVVKQDRDDNRAFYGKEMDAKTILIEGTVPIPEEAKSLAAALSWKSPNKK
ncbi:MAG TPA: lipid-binding SYLF domain-containing protein [Blastocatellia bacterium]|nr:lipid-binding SYLF domain-containing protein [Blastocatellia bacterium]